ncbi:Uncharacterised protein [Klebsiella pneumoniae]|nr:Uncharacterised protein [Klebsiella pneumoniae]
MNFEPENYSKYTLRRFAALFRCDLLGADCRSNRWYLHVY